MSQEKAKTYSAEFRESAVKLANESDKPIAQTARDLGVNENTLHTWINKYSRPLAQDKTVRTDDHLYEELKRLKKENARLIEERGFIKKGGSVLCQGATVKYAWIKQHTTEFPVDSMCRFMQVSRSAYYAWLQRPQTATEKEDSELATIIHSLFKKSRATYGTRRIKKALFDQQRTVSRRRISRLMDQENLACKTKRKFKATTDSKHDKPISPNLLDRKFKVGQPDQVYVGDITYIHTQEGWLYLAVVIDLYSRQVVGWSMAEHMRTKLVNDALLMAIWKRKPDKGLLWHTDRGSQYASESHRALLKQHSISQSMSRKGNCWDNAVSESFFHTLKTELIHHETYQTRSTAKQAVFEYIEVFYNRERRHSANGYLSPVDYELQQMAA
ncbi:IS3 family transposase [Methylovulum psychrotolerans]|nr:IS3 family transposase [Methylovulum psychrotolerans]MBT9096351.1 IS3 family transposase [Methylovulum psychrotolerans]MBT9096893.1 IS3 family transposase [Methylovulum psychrotolerans]MBT9097529.1 IS3 family transposase [Methylovulum psychrotolerans]MBT9097712.1 IS3 family transposase [Methylovulum psychrotolerans]MBT9097755.1 IS3 family transposase [Methylovulum psychrotolerans]